MREARIEPKYKCNKCHQKKFAHLMMPPEEEGGEFITCRNCIKTRGIKKLEYKNGLYYNTKGFIVKADPYGISKRISC
tara:strand:+ start:1002 stop:1235 length:234 start_codon:yes stop_codon:yes gene_type:complete